MKIVRARVSSFRLPLRSPIETALGVVEWRDGALLELESETGAKGWGEATPYPGFGRESAEDARAELTRLAHGLVGRDVASDDLRRPGAPLPPLVFPLFSPLVSAPRSATAGSAVHSALADLSARAQGVSLARLLSQGATAPPPSSISVNALLLGQSVEALAQSARECRAQGFGSAKLKVGAHDLAHDEARVSAARESLGAGVRLRLDANQAWDEKNAREALLRFSEYGIEYVEQPVAARDLDAMARLRASSPVPVAADESASDERSARAVIERGAADIIVIKPSLAGGPEASARIASEAMRAGIEVVVTSLLDGAIGLAAALHFAAYWAGASPSMPAAGLATSSVFERDLAPIPRPRGGRVELPAGPGIGLEPDAGALAGLERGEAWELRG